MIPNTTPFTPAISHACSDCGAALSVTRWRCAKCIDAAQRACANRQHGEVVRPSDVAAQRVQ